VSSNLERLLFEIAGRDEAFVRDRMHALTAAGRYEIDPAEEKNLREDFYAGWCPEADTLNAIKVLYRKTGYLMDPHTAVAHHVYSRYRDTVRDGLKTVVVSTANPYKFSADVLKALDIQTEGIELFDMAKKLEKTTRVPMPESIAALEKKPVRHTAKTNREDMPEAVFTWTGA